MRKFLFLALVLGLTLSVGYAQTPTKADIQTVKAEEAPVAERAPAHPNVGSRDPGDFLFDIDMETITGDIRLLGVEFDGTDWFLTGARDYAGCYFYEVDYAGTTLINMVATGHTGWGWRDLAYDGTYLYASDSYNLEQIDPATGTATGVVIPGPISPVRAVAYDSATDTFWTASFSSSLYQFDRSGTVLQTITNPGLAMYGAAMDEGQNTLWWWSQDGSGTLASAMDPTTGTFTGDSWDGGTNTWPGIAGGACIFDDTTYGTVLGGMHQATPDNVAVYSLMQNPMPQVDVKVNGKDSNVVIYEGNNAKITVDIEARSYAGVDVDVFKYIKDPAGTFWTYHHGGGHPYWTKGYEASYTGPLFDMNGTIFDAPGPVGKYKTFCFIDDIPNGMPDLGNIVAGDMVDAEIKSFSGLSEDFDDGVADGWVPVGPGAVGWFVANGTYQFDNSLVFIFDYHPTFYMTDQFADFTYDVDLTEEDGYTNYYYGMVLRGDGVSAKSNNYVCYVTNDGMLGFDVYVGGSVTYLVWTAPGSFIPGLMNWNTLEVVASGSNFDINVNGVYADSASDSSHSDGYIGLFGEGSGSGTNHFHFDNVIVAQ